MNAPTEQDRARCACTRCPSYIEGDSKLFCVHGKSQLKVVERGCFCRTCSVHIEYHFKGRSYCLRSRPEEQ